MENMEKQFYHCKNGTDLQKELFKPIQNHNNKPYGGLWTSTYLGEYGSDWIQWAVREMGVEECEGYVLTPKEDNNVYIIDSLEDMKKLLEEYGFFPSYVEEEMEKITKKYGDYATYGFYYVDYESMAKQYDGMQLTKKGLDDIEKKLQFLTTSIFSNFDCESTIWFHWVFKEEKEHIKFEPVYEER